MSLEVEAQDVVKLVVQFLKENNLKRTLKTLQEESKVGLNTVPSIEKFHQDILNGRWDAVLEATSTLRLPADVLIDLYEQIVVELAELREIDTARSLLRQTPAMNVLKKESPDRYLRLEHLLQRAIFDYAEAYPHGGTKESQRQKIADALKKEVVEVAPSRLLALLTQALKWQQHQGLLPKGAKYDLFSGKAKELMLEEEKVPSRPHKVVKFGKSSQPECCAFSSDGQWLATGSSDGFVEIWDFDTGKLSKELQYQAEDDIMMHDTPVLCMAFSTDSELLATGTAKGEIKVWRVLTGSCVRKFPGAHSSAVTSLAFARTGTQLISASSDNLVRMHGLKSGRTLKEFRGHAAVVNSVIYNQDGSQVISASGDGTIKFWDAKSTDCLRTVTPHDVFSAIPVNTAVVSLRLMPQNPEQVLVTTRSKTVLIMTLGGKAVKAFSTTGKDIVSACLSSQGRYVYGVAEDSVLFCFNAESRTVEHAIKLHGKEVVQITNHPHRSILASCSADGTMKLWRP